MKKRNGMHAARYSQSKRLQRVVSVMSHSKPMSTWAIQIKARVCNASTCISELRKQGFAFAPAKVKVEDGQRVFYHQLLSRKAA